jgi:hypothetical protein
MGTLRFNDGMTFNTDGPYRIVRRSDGLYVTGHGCLIPADSHEEAQVILKDLKGDENNE